MTKLLLFRTAAPVVGRFPGPFYGAAWIVATAAWFVRRQERRRVIRNLLPFCDGNVQRARREGREAFRNVARYYVDLCSLPYRDAASFEDDHIQVRNRVRIPCLFAPEPTIVASAHMGNPELSLIAIAQRGRPWVELVEPLQPDALAAFVTRLREASGGRVYPAGYQGVRAALDELRADGLVALMADRDLGGNGVCVSIAGRRVRLPRGPWELARRTGATVVPLFLERGFFEDVTVYIEQPIRVPPTDDPEDDVATAAQRWAGLFERHVRRKPGQWAVLEDFWRVHACR